MTKPTSHGEKPLPLLAEALSQQKCENDDRVCNAHQDDAKAKVLNAVRHEVGVGLGHETVAATTNDLNVRLCLSRLRKNFPRNIVVILVIIWTFLEAPLELETTTDGISRSMLILSKGVVTILGLLTVMGQQWARVVFSFILGLSVLAIGPSLGLELEYSPRYFGWSLVECVLKASALLTLVIPHRLPATKA